MKFIPTKIMAGVAAAIIFASPFAAGAVSLTDLQNQVDSLLKQIAQMQGQTGVSTTITSNTVQPQYRICGILNRSLSQGSRGDDVIGLQEFLQTQGYLAVSPTGYFGPMTSQAVAKWQTSEGVSAVGVFGPMSRERLKVRCGGGSGGSLQASPQNGASPLTVTFTPNVQIRFPSGDLGSYKIDFGDGEDQQVTCSATVSTPSTPGSCKAALVTHTYQNDGTYTALLETTPGNINPAGYTPNIVGKVQVTVGASSRGSVSATPQNGTAPLSVNFTYLPTSENGTYHIDYGDGAAEQMNTQQIYCIKAPCISPAVSSHTYASAGTYEVVVSPYIACMYSNPRCMIAVMPLAKTTVTVTGSSAGSLSANPQRGPAPLAVHFDARDNTQMSGTVYTVDFGDGSQGSVTPTPLPCAANIVCPFAGIADHSYTSSGTYTATLYRVIIGMGACISTNPNCNRTAIGSVTVTVTGNSVGAPVISSFSGPTTLALNTSGTWSIQASDPEGGTLNYDISWGDENVYTSMMTAAGSARDFVQTTTFTHAYANPGTYTVTITVRDSGGQEAKTSSTVQVGSGAVACTMEYAPVCAQPPEPACRHTPPYCAILTPGPTTYGNRCMMNAAGATYMYEGACAVTY